MRLIIRTYQLFISPIIGPRCRFLPTCSEYFLEAVENHGPIIGAKMGMKRIARCHPWGAHGYDPVPESSSAIPDSAEPITEPTLEKD